MGEGEKLMPAELFVEVSGLAGSDIEDTLRSMITLSNSIRVGVSTSFNGIKITIYYAPRIDQVFRVGSLVTKYHKACEEKDTIICG